MYGVADLHDLYWETHSMSSYPPTTAGRKSGKGDDDDEPQLDAHLLRRKELGGLCA